jgi:hypothetical protein
MNINQDTQQHAFDAEHNRVSALLPWYTNHSLPPEEARSIEVHLNRCLVCRRDFELLRVLGQQMSCRRLDPQCEAALERLHVRLDTEGFPIPWAAAAVLVLVAGFFMLVSHNAGLSPLGETPTNYTTLGVRPINTVAREVPSARIVFDENVREQEFRQLLMSIDAEVTDGPSSIGAYSIALPRVRTAADQASAFAQLRASDAVIFLEPINRVRYPAD